MPKFSISHRLKGGQQSEDKMKKLLPSPGAGGGSNTAEGDASGGFHCGQRRAKCLPYQTKN